MVNLPKDEVSSYVNKQLVMIEMSRAESVALCFINQYPWPQMNNTVDL